MTRISTRPLIWAAMWMVRSSVVSGGILSSVLGGEAAPAEAKASEVDSGDDAEIAEINPEIASDLKVDDKEVACPEEQPKSKYPWNSNCFKDPWLEKMHEIDSNAENKVFVIVGCNTGISAVRVMEQWGNRSGVHDEWSEHLKETVTTQGTCGQNYRMPEEELELERKKLEAERKKNEELRERIARGETGQEDTPAPSSRGRHNPRVLCVEPLPSTIELLDELKEEVFPRDKSLEIVQAAVSDHEGEAYFENKRTSTQHKGFEFARLKDKKERGMHVVDRTTVDAMLEQRKISKIDVLMVDTEGHDPAVLKGAANTLSKEGGTRLLIFEVNQGKEFKGTPWFDTTLKSQIDWLDEHGFDCWWPGNDGLLRRITGCWDDDKELEYSPLGWSNVACVRRGDPWHEVAESFSSLEKSTEEYHPVKRVWPKKGKQKEKVKISRKEL